VAVLLALSPVGCQADAGRCDDVADASPEGDLSDAPDGGLLPLNLASISTWGRADGFGGEGHEEGQFSYPSGIALSSDESRVYVFDIGNRAIKVMLRDGTPIDSWPAAVIPDSTGGSGIAVAPDGTVYVADDTIHGVAGYSPDGSVRHSWRLANVRPYRSYEGHPHDLIVSSDGNIVVAEAGLGQLQVFTPDGALLRTIGERGTEKGQFQGGPGGVAELGGRFYATDFKPGAHPFGHTILIFEQDGRYVGMVPPPQGALMPALATLIVSWHGWLFVGAADEPPEIILGQAPGFQRLTHRWEGSRGVFPGELNAPYDAAVDAQGRWYVTELYNHRVQVFQSNLTTP
jgi:DNA-binding beta-propeller fold protein YncE